MVHFIIRETFNCAQAVIKESHSRLESLQTIHQSAKFQCNKNPFHPRWHQFSILHSLSQKDQPFLSLVSTVSLVPMSPMNFYSADTKSEELPVTFSKALQQWFMSLHH